MGPAKLLLLINFSQILDYSPCKGQDQVYHCSSFDVFTIVHLLTMCSWNMRPERIIAQFRSRVPLRRDWTWFCMKSETSTVQMPLFGKARHEKDLLEVQQFGVWLVACNQKYFQLPGRRGVGPTGWQIQAKLQVHSISSSNIFHFVPTNIGCWIFETEKFQIYLWLGLIRHKKCYPRWDFANSVCKVEKIPAGLKFCLIVTQNYCKSIEKVSHKKGLNIWLVLPFCCLW